MMRPSQLDPDRVLVLVIDMQEKLLPLIRDHARIVDAGKKLLGAAPIFELPVIATEQNPHGIGSTVSDLTTCLEESRATTIEKSTFSAWAEDSVRQAILALDRPQVLMMGIETHVCILQTALDMVSRAYDVHVCGDAVGSRGRLDHKVAFQRLRQEGVRVTTVESALFELCGRCDAPHFKAILDLIKRFPPSVD